MTSTGFGRHAGRAKSGRPAGDGPADRTAARRPSRAESELTARHGWREVSRVTLRREVCAAAAAASSEQEFFARLRESGVLVRRRASTRNPGEITGYAVALEHHTSRDGAVVWYGGGKLAADPDAPEAPPSLEATDRPGTVPRGPSDHLR
jgi:hypothetical protein